MKRGSSGLSLVVAVDKPSGMSSHDVVNRCRRIFGERRVGHTGTLDPLACGVLPICVGPATRLDKYLTGHDKRYRVTMRFGFETDTDDSQGNPTVTGKVPDDLFTGSFAANYVEGLVGVREQVPPAYSAVKIAGKKAYELARVGADVHLEPRSIEVFEARLADRRVERDALYWDVDFSVSKGTYIRALVRDMGRELGCPAHVSALERRTAGPITIEDCISLETLADRGVSAAIDPVRLLGYRIAFADDIARLVDAGNKVRPEQMRLFAFKPYEERFELCSCTGSIEQNANVLEPDELVSVVVENRLKAIYRYDAPTGMLVADCVFSTPVIRTWDVSWVRP